MMNGNSNLGHSLDGSSFHDDSDRIDDDDHLCDDEDSDGIIHSTGRRNNGRGGIVGFVTDLIKDLWVSSGLVLNNKLNWLLIMGPIALMGDATGLLGETLCFAFSGLALIPCAERLSFVTEQVAEHTNGTIGALLNATFGNAPELLIASAALRKGFYRVVQLAMLGSMLTNLLFVFGISCMIGGFRWQVQELRITSGNVSVGMLLLSTAGSLLPATLVLGGQLKESSEDGDGRTSGDTAEGEAELPSLAELQFCRVNALVMIIMYGCYLIFQLGTHKEEFDEEQTTDAHQLHMSPHLSSRHGQHQKARRNVFCMWLVRRTKCFLKMDSNEGTMAEAGDVELMYRDNNNQLLGLIPNENDRNHNLPPGVIDDDDSSSNDECLLPQNASLHDTEDYFDDYAKEQSQASINNESKKKKKNAQRSSGALVPLGLAEASEPTSRVAATPVPILVDHDNHHQPAAQMSFRVGILWLFIITLAVSAMSEILVDTIGGFAARSHMSEVFTSMVIVPFFSNVAEQVSAIIFAYRNEMDLCVGVTVGSAIQVASFVLPGCVLIGWLMDRSMTLYFHAYETACLFLAVVVIAAFLQGGTTNWLSGATCVSVYIMIASGFWFHSLEYLSYDEETAGQNSTRALLFAV